MADRLPVEIPPLATHRTAPLEKSPQIESLRENSPSSAGKTPEWGPFAAGLPSGAAAGAVAGPQDLAGRRGLKPAGGGLHKLIRKGDTSMSDTNPSHISLRKVVQRDPDVHSGDLVFTGTRVPVGNLVDCLKGGDSIEEFLRDYPTVQCWQLESYLELSRRGLDRMRAQDEGTSR